MSSWITNKGKSAFCYGSAQHEFIKSVRSSVLQEGASFFKKKDWKNIGPVSNTSLALAEMKICSDSFYIKNVAVWVPHLLLPNHIPTCPNCKRSSGVDLSKAEFVERPKILHGIRSHRYLDTMSYKCMVCNKSFTGYNPKSLEQDAAKVLGIFTFYICKGFGVDEECYSYESRTISLVFRHESRTSAHS